MLKIDRDYKDYKHGAGGFIVSISEPGTGRRGRSFYAAGLTEITLACAHYFAGPIGHVSGSEPFCPLCRIEKYPPACAGRKDAP